MKESTTSRSAADEHDASGNASIRGTRDRTSAVSERIPSIDSESESSSRSARLKSKRRKERHLVQLEMLCARKSTHTERRRRRCDGMVAEGSNWVELWCKVRTREHEKNKEEAAARKDERARRSP
jgi:hypothetical protein